MNHIAIIRALLNVPAVTSLVPYARIADTQLPTGTAMPAIVLSTISALPEPSLNYNAAPRARARVQINPLALNPAGVRAVQAAVRSALDFQHQVTAAGKLVVSCRFGGEGIEDKDTETGYWTQPADYILLWVE